MSLTGFVRKALAVITAGAAVAALAACVSNDETAAPAPSAAPGGSTGTLLPGAPDVNGDGKVVIGVLSPGDINDNGYYESFVVKAEAFAQAQDWTVIKRGSVPVSEALTAARALCRQRADMVAIGASELKDAIPASEEAVCARTAWYVPSSANVPQTPRIMLSSDDPNQSMLVAGYAAGLLMRARNTTRAGFVTGPEADFTKIASTAFLAGIRELIPGATLVTTYTGDFDDSGKAREATQAQLSQGVGAIYPYLGGATDVATALANSAGAITLTPGTDRCASTSPTFDVSVLFDPGDYFAAALQLYAAGRLEMGITKTWQLGVDPYPTVKLCKGTPEQNADLAAFIADIGRGTIDPAAEVRRLGS
ncbi:MULTISPECIES: BMP family ABC transporter substrate-binding protein [Catenuloplanes]|uniref:Basic membrane protein A n=1 Tax=Catenuloplanes niger TaxID=587534 RepID=A0AAE3ZYB5_9ACTN|nr:BMP family ABC transporter substrate-binding protein [Catenuloplanes niger]MDR7326025.1 basic membrane protein A [Catenuloplanes niger]